MRTHWIVVAAITVAGCGSSQSLTQEELVGKADKICSERNAKTADLFEDISPRMSEEELTDSFKRYVEHYETQYEALADLDAPESADAWDRYLDRHKRNLDGLKDAIDGGQFTSYDFNSKIHNSELEANTLAREAGLHTCNDLDYV